MPRFTAQELAFLRNRLPIASVLSELALPTQQHDDILRFRCPLCGQFHTALHPRENLARCFDCQTNFNPIELVMAVRHLPFRDAVTFLQRHQQLSRQADPQQANGHPPAQQTAPPPPNPPSIPTSSGTPPTKRERPAGLVALKEILARHSTTG